MSGRLGLAGIVKRTYSFDAGGHVGVADAQVDIVVEPEMAEDHRDGCQALLDDTDLLARKELTDIVVRGRGYGWGRPEALAGFAVGGTARQLSLHGERAVEIRPDGTVRFSPPVPFESVDLDHRNAYGGCDYHALARMAPPPRPGAKAEQVGVFAYPRNPAGRAYFIDIDRHRAAGTTLPSIEDPADPLTPERFFVRSPVAWLDAPVSGSWGWVHYTWYPRIFRLLGPVLPRESPERPVREERYADGNDLQDIRRPRAGTVHSRALQGAAPGLAVGRLRGAEPVALRGLHRSRRDLRFDLPAEVPRVGLRAPDVRELTPEATLQTLRLEPELDRFSLTWCAVVPLLAQADEDYLGRVEMRVTWARL